MSYWYLQRSGIPFNALWFKYGTVPDNVTQEYYDARLAEASSIYFVNLVVMYVLKSPYTHGTVVPRIRVLTFIGNGSALCPSVPAA